jgi:hypothetical protein
MISCSMNRFYLTALLCLYTLTSSGQLINCFDAREAARYDRRVNNVIGLIPSKARVTNGLAVGWLNSLEANAWCRDSLRINGVYMNVSPLQPILISMVAVMLPFALFSPATYEKWNWEYEPEHYDTIQMKHKLNGVAVSLMDEGDLFILQGIQVTLIGHSMGKLNGVSLTGLVCEYKFFNGLMIAGILNKGYKGKGLQIGLLNKAHDMRGVQIGLWNQIGKRGLPFINMKF